MTGNPLDTGNWWDLTEGQRKLAEKYGLLKEFENKEKILFYFNNDLNISEASKYLIKEHYNKKLTLEDIRNLEVVTDKEFSQIVGLIIKSDYKNIPNITRLPDLDQELAQKLNLESNKVYLLKGESAHIRPARKGLYNQALRKEEYESIPEILRIAKFAVIDIENENLQIVFADMVRSEYINKIIINKNKLGNWIVTVGKVEKKYEFSEKKNKIVRVGVAPTISPS